MRATQKGARVTILDIVNLLGYIYPIVWRIKKAGHVDPPRCKSRATNSRNVLTAKQSNSELEQTWRLLSYIGVSHRAVLFIFSQSPNRQNCYKQYAFLHGGLPPPKRNTELLRLHGKAKTQQGRQSSLGCYLLAPKYSHLWAKGIQ